MALFLDVFEYIFADDGLLLLLLAQLLLDRCSLLVQELPDLGAYLSNPCFAFIVILLVCLLSLLLCLFMGVGRLHGSWFFELVDVIIR